MACWWILKSCLLRADTRAFIGRRTRSDLMKSTFVSFKKVCRAEGIIEGTHFKHNYQTNETHFPHNGSVILWEPLDERPSDPEYQRFGSLELTMVFIEEAGEIARRCYQILSSRIRHNLPNGRQKMLLTCNPSKNFLYREFYKPYKNNELDKDKIFIPALVTDNFAPDDPYVLGLHKLDSVDKERLLYGNWDYEDNEDCIFEAEDIIDLFTNLCKVEKGRYISVDVAGAGKDRCVIMFWRGLVVEEIYIAKKSREDDIHYVIKELKKRHSVGNSNIVIDADGMGVFVAEKYRGCNNFMNGSAPIIDDKFKNKEDLPQRNFANLKTQCYYKMAELTSEKLINIKTDKIYTFGYKDFSITSGDLEDTIIEELSWVRRKESDSDGKTRLIDKKEIKKSLDRSPDYADALMMRMVFELKGRKNKKTTLDKDLF